MPVLQEERMLGADAWEGTAMSGTLAVSWGSNGGVYVSRFPGRVWRICLWRIALTWCQAEWEDIVNDHLAAGGGSDAA